LFKCLKSFIYSDYTKLAELYEDPNQPIYRFFVTCIGSGRVLQYVQYAERWESFCAVHEIIDINRYKIIRKPWQIQQILQDKPVKPFVFLINKN